MDARDLSEQIFRMWQDKYPKNSGDIHKSLQKIRVTINTDEGYREVVGLIWNNETNLIELVLDNE